MEEDSAGPAPGDELVNSEHISTFVAPSRIDSLTTTDVAAVEPPNLARRADQPLETATPLRHPSREPVDDAVKPGAYVVESRAIGARPPWARRMSAHFTASFPSRGSQQSASQGTNATGSSGRRSRTSRISYIIGYGDGGRRRSSLDQSHVPPEMRTSRNSVARSQRPSLFLQMFGARSDDVIVADCEPASEAISRNEEEVVERNARKGIAIIFCAGLLLIAITVGVAVGVTAGGNSEPKLNNPAPIPAPITIIEVTASARQIALQNKLEYLCNDVSVFDDSLSAQSLALTWLANADDAEISESDQARLEARYALATLYFATAGESWSDDLEFLTKAHECAWASSSTGQGVTCNAEEEVTKIAIGKQKQRLDYMILAYWKYGWRTTLIFTSFLYRRKPDVWLHSRGDQGTVVPGRSSNHQSNLNGCGSFRFDFHLEGIGSLRKPTGLLDPYFIRRFVEFAQIIFE
jgi:hypothetical protein